jgi:hypothetical protein
MSQSMRPLWIITLIVFSLLWPLTSGHAQEATLSLGQNALGEVSAQQPAPAFQFRTDSSQAVTVTLQSLSSNFAPLLILYDDQGIIQRLPNLNAKGTLQTGFLASSTATYTLQVQGVEGGTGQFVISITEGEFLPPPASELRPGMQIEDRVTPTQPIQRYQIAAERQSGLIVQIISLPPQSGISIILSNEGGQPLAVMRQGLLGSSFILPPATDLRYDLTIVHSGAERIEGYQLSLQVFGAQVTPPVAAPQAPADAPIQATQATSAPIQTAPSAPTQAPQVVIPFDGPCAVASKDKAGVNVRRGPGVGYEVVDGLTADKILTVTGRNENFTWWQVEYRAGLYGWVVDRAIRRGGDCTGIGLAEYPALPDNGVNSISSTPSALEALTLTPEGPAATAEGGN